jgi:lysophospholipase L1-like esterase
MKHYQKIILCVLAVSLAVIFGEWYVRTWYPQLTLEAAQSFSFNCFEEGEHRWIKLASNKTCILKSQWHAFEPIEVKTNSLGLRNPEIPKQKPEGEKRVLFVGDSFTMGWGVKEQESFARKTETLLHEQGLTNITTINAGFSAAGPSGYYLYLKYFGLDLDPDIVVIGFFIGNDITARKDIEWIKTDEYGLPDIVRSKSTYIDNTGTLRFTDTPLRYKIPVLNNSHAFLMLVNAISPQQISTDPSKEMIRQLTCLFKSDCHDLDTAKKEVQFLFKGINSLLTSKGKKLVVLIIPDDYQVNAYPTYKYVQGLPLLPSERRSINNEYIRFFESEKITYIDVLPSMMEQAKEPLYIPEDGHWNAAGHAFTAEILSTELAKLLPTPTP